TDRNDNWLEVLARLRPGASFAQAATELRLVAAQLEQKYPKELENTGVTVLRLRDEVSNKSKTLLLALCGAALCILLLACANLASLLLARAVSREREIAVRAALRAGGARGFVGLRSGARAGGGRKQRARGVLVAIEVGASVVLLISSGLLMRTMWRLQTVDLGFRAEGALMVRTALPWHK